MSNQDNSRIAKNTIFLSIRMVVVMVISIFTTRLLLEGLGVKDYGIYNVTIGVVTLCSFLQPALANGIQRFFNFEIGKHNLPRAKNVFNTGVQIQILVSLIFILLCETVGLWYVSNKVVVDPERYNATQIIYQISVLSLVFNMMQVPFMAAVMAHEKMDFFALISVIDAILKLGIAFFLRFANIDHLVLYSFLLLSVTIFNFFVYAWYSMRKFSEIRFQKAISKDLFKPMLSFVGWNLLEKFARVGKDQGINLSLNYYFGPVVNAARGIVSQVTYAFGSLVDSTVTASRPQSIQSYARGEFHRTLHIMYSLSKFIVLMLYVLILPIFLELPYVLHLWLGDNIPDFTIPLLKIGLLTIVVDKLAAPISVVVHATGRMKHFNMVSCVMNIVVVPISVIALMQGVDAVFVYWIIFIMTLFTQIALLFSLRRLIDLSILVYVKEVLVRSAFVVILSFWLPLLIHSIMEEGFLRLAVVLMSSLIIGSVVAFLIGLDESERSVCLSFINRKL